MMFLIKMFCDFPKCLKQWIEWHLTLTSSKNSACCKREPEKRNTHFQRSRFPRPLLTTNSPSTVEPLRLIVTTKHHHGIRDVLFYWYMVIPCDTSKTFKGLNKHVSHWKLWTCIKKNNNFLHLRMLQSLKWMLASLWISLDLTFIPQWLQDTKTSESTKLNG